MPTSTLDPAATLAALDRGELDVKGQRALAEALRIGLRVAGTTVAEVLGVDDYAARLQRRDALIHAFADSRRLPTARQRAAAVLEEAAKPTADARIAEARALLPDRFPVSERHVRRILERVGHPRFTCPTVSGKTRRP